MLPTHVQSRLISIAFDKSKERVFDRAAEIAERFSKIITQTASKFSSKDIIRLDPISMMLLHMCGHRGSYLRSLINQGSSEESIYLKSINDLASELSDSQTAAKALSSILAIDIPETLQYLAASDDDHWYALDQYISFLELSHRHAAYNQLPHVLAKTVGLDKEETKWIDLLDHVFASSDVYKTIVALLNNVGSIPEELMNKRKFSNKYKDQPRLVTQFIQTLRAIEYDEKQSIEIKRLARFERAKVSNFLFTQGLADNLRTSQLEVDSISLDTNGIFIRLFGFETHIPYGLLNQHTIDYFQESINESTHSWVSNNQLHEIRTRYAKENNLIEEYVRARSHQLDFFTKSYHALDSSTDDSLEGLVLVVLQNPRRMAEIIVNDRITIPDALLQEMVFRRGSEGVFGITKVGEYMQLQLTKEDAIHEDIHFFLHNLDQSEYAAREARTKLLNHPQLYSSLKITRNVIAYVKPSSDDKRFILVAGKSKKLRTAQKKKHQRSFIEAIYNGQTARILIDEDKHLGVALKKKLDLVIQISTEQYPRFEQSVQAFHFFGHTIELMKKALNEKHAFDKETFSAHHNNALYFLLTYFSAQPGYHARAANQVSILSKSDELNVEGLSKLVAILQDAHDVYAEYFYTALKDPENTPLHFNPEITTTTVEYSATSLKQIKDRFKLFRQHWTNGIVNVLDENQYIHNFTTKAVSLNYALGSATETIPHHLMLECFDRLGVSLDRPLINVIGGCRLIDPGSHLQDMHTYANAVITILQKIRGNAAVPPLQSGISEAFGQANIALTQYYEALNTPREEQAHIFTVAPGGNMVYDGNPFFKAKATRHTYAMTAVDAIVTPPTGEWDLIGYERLKSKYNVQIAYMEALYALISTGQQRITIVGNGGFYSLLELNEAIPRGFDVMFIADTGRLSEMFSAIFPHIDSLPLEEIRLDTIEDFESNDQETLIQELYSLVYTFITNSSIDRTFIIEFFEKDFGPGEILDKNHPKYLDYEVFRKILIRVLQLTKRYKEKIFLTTINELQEDLQNYFDQKKQDK